MRYVFYINPTAGKGDAQNSIINSIENYFVDKSTNTINITKDKIINKIPIIWSKSNINLGIRIITDDKINPIIIL